MSDVSANLSLPYILAAQAQKHVTHNEAIRALDAIVQLAVLDRDLAAPPGSPAEGDRYIVADAPTGAWSGRAGDIAAFLDGAWAFLSPREGWRAWISDEARLLVHDGAGWTAVGGEAAVNPAPLVGVNAVADGVNRLAVKSDAVLFSHDDVTPGSGDMRLAINKADAGGVASVVFQDAFSGRAEFGLAAGDLFELKVSTDGTEFTSALSIDPADGVVELPQGAVLNGGTIDGATIGGTSAGAGTFTTATANAFVPNHSAVPTNGMYLPAANTLGFACNSTGEVQITSTAMSPVTSDGNALGTTSLMWSDLFLAAAGVINWNNGAATLAEEAGSLNVVADAILLEKTSTSENGVQIRVSNPSTEEGGSCGFAWASGTAALGGFGAVHADAFTYMFTDAGSFMLIAEDELHLLSNTSAGVFFDDINTTAAAANAVLDASTGQLARSTSSVQFKRNVEPMDPAIAARIIDGCEPIWYRSSIPTDRQDWSWYGLSAEAMADLDPRFVQWGYRPEDMERVPTGKVMGRQQYKLQPKEGAELVPVGVAYERLSVPALVVIQDLKGMVAALQERVIQLEARSAPAQ
jgi:hypothetical protein